VGFATGSSPAAGPAQLGPPVGGEHSPRGDALRVRDHLDGALELERRQQGARLVAEVHRELGDQREAEDQGVFLQFSHALIYLEI
jgi:hypothetical protein